MSPHKYVLKYTFSQCNDDIIKCISSPCNSLDGLYNAKVITTVIHKFAHIFSSTILDVEQCKKKKKAEYSNNDAFTLSESQLVGLSEEDREMITLMGFANFETTKVKSTFFSYIS